MRNTLNCVTFVVVFALYVVNSAYAGTVQDIQQRGKMRCGVATGLPGFAERGPENKWSGIDVDICRAVAAAVLGDDSKVEYIPLITPDRFSNLISGKIDLLVRNTTWTQTRDTTLGINFAGVNYYDGQSFMVRKSTKIRRLSQLDKKTICVQSATTHELNLIDYFSLHKLTYTPISFETSEQTIKAFEGKKCDVLTSDQSQLFALRTMMKNKKDIFILPDLISKEPLGPAVREGDEQWFSLVQWSLFAMINAEELGVSSKNVEKMKSSKNPQIRRLLGGGKNLGRNFGVERGWGYRIIKQVGNYAEIFERNVGMQSPLKIHRGLNALWSDGGIQYAPPVR